MSSANGGEVTLDENDFIVSKTDPKGKITYCNRIFIDISGFSEAELLQQPHKIVRHPDMPKAVFRLLWQTLQSGHEFLGYVKNRTKSGGFYWVFAHVTPSYDANNNLLGYYSARRRPSREAVNTFADIYRRMVEIEGGHSSAKEAMDASMEFMNDFIRQSEKSYDELILSYEN